MRRADPGAASGGRRSFPLPRRAVGPVVAAVVTLAGWTAVAHSSGAGWVQALGAILAGFLAVGLLAPSVAVARARCVVVENPADATAGQPVEITLAVSAPVRVLPLSPPGPPAVSGRSDRFTVSAVPRGRGELASVTVELASAAPFGLLWWTRRCDVPLARPLLVAPRRGTPGAAVVPAAGGAGERSRQIAARVGEPRGARGYEPGDLRQWVHWPATAHTGTLMIREMEQPASAPLVVRAALPADPDAAEEQAERVLGTVDRLLGLGWTVVLVTDEPEGPRRAPVESTAGAGRRLARAVSLPSLPPAPPEPPPRP